MPQSALNQNKINWELKYIVVACVEGIKSMLGAAKSRCHRTAYFYFTKLIFEWNLRTSWSKFLRYGERSLLTVDLICCFYAFVDFSTGFSSRLFHRIIYMYQFAMLIEIQILMTSLARKLEADPNEWFSSSPESHIYPPVGGDSLTLDKSTVWNSFADLFTYIFDKPIKDEKTCG